MLGGAEALTIQVGVDAKKTGVIFLGITQRGEVCTVDSSVAKCTRSVRTWTSGHDFCESLVSRQSLVRCLSVANWFLLRDDFGDMFPYPTWCLARQWIHVHASVYGGFWKNFTCFPREGGLGG